MVTRPGAAEGMIRDLAEESFPSQILWPLWCPQALRLVCFALCYSSSLYQRLRVDGKVSHAISQYPCLRRKVKTLDTAARSFTASGIHVCIAHLLKLSLSCKAIRPECQDPGAYSTPSDTSTCSDSRHLIAQAPLGLCTVALRNNVSLTSLKTSLHK